MKQKLTLPRAKKKHSRRHMLPLAIAGLVVVGGFATIAYEVFIELPELSCNGANCERQVSLDIATKSSKGATESSENLNIEIGGNNEPSRLDDIELENNRLLLQRDIQRSINATSPKKPFNYKEGDFCTLTLGNDRTSLKITKCSNQVYKRTFDLSLSEISVESILSKYDFKDLNPTLEARLKF